MHQLENSRSHCWRPGEFRFKHMHKGRLRNVMAWGGPGMDMCVANHTSPDTNPGQRGSSTLDTYCGGQGPERPLQWEADT